MIILKNALYSHEKWNQKLSKYKLKGYTLKYSNKSFVVMTKNEGPQYYFNITSLSGVSSDRTISSSNTFDTAISTKRQDVNNEALVDYYNWIIKRHNDITFRMLMPIILIVITYEFMPQVIQYISTLLILIIFVIAFLRNLSRKAFLRNVVKPHTLKYRVHNQLLSKVYIVKTENELNVETLELLSNCGNVQKVKSTRKIYNYKLDSILERTEILKILENASQKLDVFTTEMN